MPWPPPGSRFYCRHVAKIKVFRILNTSHFGIVFSMIFDAKWLQKCSKNAFVELPSPPKSHQHRQMGSKATPRGTKNRPRRAQVVQKGAQGDPKWPREPPKCDLLLHKIGMGTSWLDPVLFRRRFALIFHWFGIKFAWLFHVFSCNFCAFLATIWKTWVGWGVGGGGGRKHTFQMHLHSHQIPARPNPMTGTVRHCFATWIY